MGESSRPPAESRSPADRLRASQVLDAAPDAIVVVDGEARIGQVNSQTEALFGYDWSELAGQPLELLIPEAARAAHRGHVAKYFEHASTRVMASTLDLFGRRRDGTEIPVEVSLSPVQTAEGLLVCASVRDVSERKRIEAKAKLNADRLVSAIESIEDAFALFDADGRLVLCNSAYRTSAAANLSGQLIGRPYADVLDSWLDGLVFSTADERTAFRSSRLAARNERRDVSDVLTDDGRKLRVITKRTAEGGMVQTIWDLTEDLQREEDLRQMRTEAEAASNAKSEFLSAMSHELRTPLNAVLGFAQLLHRDKKAPLVERHRERVGHILKGGEHLLQLIDEILDLSRIEAGHVPISLEPVVVAEVLEEVRNTLEPMASRAEVALDIEPHCRDLPQVIADRIRFKQVLMNFGSNAIKYGSRGGYVRVRCDTNEGYVRVVVADDGIGVPEDKQERLFEPFYRAGQETGGIEGTGIGLAITKRLVALMQGRVGFRSQVGHGSEFWVELPSQKPRDQAATPARSVSAGAGESLQGPGDSTHLILYVEDNPSNIAFMEDLLGDFGRIQLLTAPTAEIGIDLARARQPDVVIMDINLPGMSGIEATKQLQAWPETSAIPVVALSAAATPRDVTRSDEIGFYRYLTKPVEVDKLTQVLEELLTAEPAG